MSPLGYWMHRKVGARTGVIQRIKMIVDETLFPFALAIARFL